MSETLSQPDQTNNSAPTEWEQTMREAREEYKTNHPDAVDDVNKARFMAGAEDALRTSAAQHNQRLQALKQKIEDAHNDAYERRSTQDAVAAEQMAVDEANRRADIAGATAAKRYDQVHDPESSAPAPGATYKDIYPNAIDDPEKARAMAEAGNAIESTRAGHQRRLDQLTEQFDNAYDQHGDPLAETKARTAFESAQVAQGDVAEATRMANNIENAAAKRYDQEHGNS